MTKSKKDIRQLSIWLLIFLKSRVNGAPYRGEELPERKWNWLQGTYLQQRLQYLRGSQKKLRRKAIFSRLAHTDRSAQARFELLYEKLLEQF
ncbi:MAG: hypothetical protein V3U06_03075 [Candidatus Binatia bacterium]